MKYVDTHCHLEQSDFASDLDEVIDRAANLGVHTITSAITISDWETAVEIATKHDNVDVSLGVDPILYDHLNFIPDKWKKWIDILVAIGEVGLDHYRERDHELRDIQEQMFRKAILFAEEQGLPIQVHSRSAGKKALEVLRDCDASMVHMHAFDGKAGLARVASNEYDYYFSIPTSVVRSPQKQKLVKAVNIERLLLETDSPVLGPDKGVRNEPSNIPLVVKEIASILRLSKEEVRQIALENTLRLYKRIKP
jgi:TatD DNase family protein